MVQIEQEIVRSGEAALETPHARTWYRRYGKRGLDLAMGVALLLMTVPLVLVLAVLVALTSGWPPFYVATRIGRDGKPFRLWKLRTMVGQTAPDGTPRVTLLGRFLRMSTLDRLPAVWSIVRYGRDTVRS